MPSSSLIGPIAPIIGAIVGAILTALFYWWRTRVRPHYLVCEEQLRTSVVEVRGGMTGEALKISYGNQEVQNLSLVRLRFFNDGSDEIKNADVCVRLDEGARIIEPRYNVAPEPLKRENVIASPPPGDPFEKPTVEPPNQRTFHIKYLKPLKTYKQEIVIDLICDGEIREVPGVFGDAPNWSLKFTSLVDQERRAKRTGSVISFIGGIIATIAAIVAIATFLFQVLDLFKQ
jgi:hypothetical protein